MFLISAGELGSRTSEIRGSEVPVPVPASHKTRMDSRSEPKHQPERQRRVGESKSRSDLLSTIAMRGSEVDQTSDMTCMTSNTS
jgi:hypothetical protein